MQLSRSGNDFDHACALCFIFCSRFADLAQIKPCLASVDPLLWLTSGRSSVKSGEDVTDSAFIGCLLWDLYEINSADNYESVYL